MKPLPGLILPWSLCLMRSKDRERERCFIFLTWKVAAGVESATVYLCCWCPFVVFPAPEIDEAAVMQLAEMGFPLEACRKAVYYTGNMGPEMAFNWIIAHMEEPGKDVSLHGKRLTECWICIDYVCSWSGSRKINTPLFSKPVPDWRPCCAVCWLKTLDEETRRRDVCRSTSLLQFFQYTEKDQSRFSLCVPVCVSVCENINGNFVRADFVSQRACQRWRCSPEALTWATSISLQPC